jgi:O-antigen/teichoic acid export membrane protein
VATRLVNLTVLPAGAALAAVAPTALQAVYPSLGNQTVPFAILAVTIIFSAQSLLLTTTLQAIGRTTRILGISLGATIIDLVAVGFGAPALGTTAGAVGRALLTISMSFLAWLSLRSILEAPVTKGLSKALVLALSSAAPLVIVDNVLTLSLHLTPIVRLPVLLAVFAICFLSSSRILSAFTQDDFELFENALPTILQRPLEVIELVVRRN